jgi:glucose/arabinose dehydrogenase
MRIAQPYSNHNGGNVAFGPDGYLYIGMGDGGSGGDPQNRAQSMRTRLGKMLRIDVNGTQGTLQYRIPASNPYRTRIGVPKEIYSIGLRNPWRFSFDRSRGDLWIGDVGQSAVEEIDFNAAGLGRGVNYGWRRFEGRSRYSSSPLGPGRLIWPVATFSHRVGCSVTGGFVYRGPSIPGLDGRYLFSDFCASRIWSMRAGPTPGDRRDISATLGVRIPKFGVRTFGEGGDGTLYVANATQIWRFSR